VTYFVLHSTQATEASRLSSVAIPTELVAWKPEMKLASQASLTKTDTELTSQTLQLHPTMNPL